MKLKNNKKKCFIIAEIGVNHNGNLKVAKNLIIAAKKSGADAVKFQTFKADFLVKQGTPKAPYQYNSSLKKETQYEMLKKLELDEKSHFILKKICKLNKIEFISTPFDLTSLKFLIKLGVKKIKISSSDLTDHIMHNYLAKKKISTIISTGMSNLKEIDETVKIYKKNNNKNYSLLHCISNYPCSDESLNLKNLITLKKRYNCKIGFSDHSIGNIGSVLSIAYGAEIIEKHLTLNKKMPGPDHKASITPKEFKILVSEIRRAEVMKGDSYKKLRNEEKNNRLLSRKSLIYNNDLDKGKVLKIQNISSLRPGHGILGNKINLILNKKLKKKVVRNSFIRLSDFE